MSRLGSGVVKSINRYIYSGGLKKGWNKEKMSGSFEKSKTLTSRRENRECHNARINEKLVIKGTTSEKNITADFPAVTSQLYQSFYWTVVLLPLV